ncbi:hypothetical protein LCGC14_2918490, partial [marine sediment metagenome]
MIPNRDKERKHILSYKSKKEIISIREKNYLEDVE